MEGTLYTKDYIYFKVLDTQDLVLWEGTDGFRLLPGDRARVVENRLEPIVCQEHKGIVGILQTSSKIKSGIDKRGHIIYIFRPIDPSYPEFIVASSLKNQLANQWCLVDYLDWPANSKRPRGGVQVYLGQVGDYAVELEAVYKHYRPKPVDWKHWRADYATQVQEIVAKYNRNDWRVGREAFHGYTVSIDPAGCKDIDDALSLRELHPGIWQLSIHIADVSYWIDPDSPLDKIARQLGSTLYGYQVNFPIFPRELSEGIFSLLPGGGQSRTALTLKIVLDCETKMIIDHCFNQTVIQNNGALDYDNYRTDTNINWDRLFDCAELLAKQLGLPPIATDSHKLVEVLMIYYNQYVAHMGSGIYRVQAKSMGGTEEEYPPELRFLGLETAIYSPIAGTHSCLGLTAYTHATSPIRRYADLLVQRNLLNLSRITQETLAETIRELNSLQKCAKRFHRDIQFIRAIYENMDRTVRAIVLDKEHIYIPDWGQRARFTNELDRFAHISLKYYIDPNPIQWKKKIIFQQS